MTVLGMILAGGEGTRLRPLTDVRAKPAVPFGGRYRVVDFALSNFVNSGIYKIKVLTQYKSDSLLKHIMRGWGRDAGFDGFIEPLPPQMNTSRNWYEGSVDAIFQNLNIIADEAPDLIAVFGGDQIFKMDITQMMGFHYKKDAAITVAAVPVPVSEATRFGCIRTDDDGRVIGFDEKPAIPPQMPERPGYALVSMGSYLFNTSALIRETIEDSEAPNSTHDLGADLLTSVFEREPVFAYDFSENIVPGELERTRGYWIDIGTIESYWQSSMDLVSVSPIFNLYNDKWPIRTHCAPAPPAKFVFSDQKHGRVGAATDSLVSEGCIISGGQIERCILSPSVRVNSYSHVAESVLFENVTIGRRAKVRRAIIDKGVEIAEDAVIGYDVEEDKKKYFVSDTGIVVVRKPERVLQFLR